MWAMGRKLMLSLYFSLFSEWHGSQSLIETNVTSVRWMCTVASQGTCHGWNDVALTHREEQTWEIMKGRWEGNISVRKSMRKCRKKSKYLNIKYFNQNIRNYKWTQTFQTSETKLINEKFYARKKEHQFSPKLNPYTL